MKHNEDLNLTPKNIVKLKLSPKDLAKLTELQLRCHGRTERKTCNILYEETSETCKMLVTFFGKRAKMEDEFAQESYDSRIWAAQFRRQQKFIIKIMAKSKIELSLFKSRQHQFPFPQPGFIWTHIRDWTHIRG